MLVFISSKYLEPVGLTKNLTENRLFPFHLHFVQEMVDAHLTLNSISFSAGATGLRAKYATSTTTVELLSGFRFHFNKLIALQSFTDCVQAGGIMFKCQGGYYEGKDGLLDMRRRR